MYFFSQYGARSVETFVILRCVGLFVSATLPVLIIMGPKFTAIKFKNVSVNALWGSRGSTGKSGKDDSSSASVAPVEGNRSLLVLTKEAFTGRVCTAMQVIPEKSPYEYRSPSKMKFNSLSQSRSQSQSQSLSISDMPSTPVELSQG